MAQISDRDATFTHRYALCIGIGDYTNLTNHKLRYAVDDADAIAKQLSDPQRGNFAVTVLTEPTQTTKSALQIAVTQLLSAPECQAEDLTLIYVACHGYVDYTENPPRSYLVPSDATLRADKKLELENLISPKDLAKWFAGAKTRKIVLLLDVCHSGGAVAAFHNFEPKLETSPNYFILGAARQDQITHQSGKLKHGLLTHCLLRAFAQPPNKDGWLTLSQVQIFVAEEIPMFAKDSACIQGIWLFDGDLPLVRNPSYPELSPLPPFWNIPFQRNIFFTGQEKALTHLDSLLHSEEEAALKQPCAISGLGGIGKTELALEYAYRHRQNYHAVLWGFADTRENIIASFVSAALLLDLPEKNEENQMVIVKAVKTWLMKHANWLLILDNADNLALVKEFIPPAFQGQILLTTRAESPGELAQRLEIEPMISDIGALLLLRRAGLVAKDALLEVATLSDVEIARKITKELGGLPLALDQAGAYIEETKSRFSDYLQHYQERQAFLLQQRGGVRPNHPDPVATTWFLSFERVKQQSPVAADLLRFCAYLAPDAIPEEIITKGAEHLGPLLGPIAIDPFLLDQAIKALGAYSLLKRSPQMQILSIHRLVQTVLRDAMTEEERFQWAERAVQLMNMTFPNPYIVENWHVCQSLLPHIFACIVWIKHIRIRTEEAASLLNEVAYYLTAQGLFEEAEPMAEEALTIVREVLGERHPYAAMSLNTLARLYRSQGLYEEAEPVAKKALVIAREVLGEQHPDTARVLNDLALLYSSQGRYEEAEPLCKEALAVRRKVLGEQHVDTVASFYNLTLLYRNQGREEEAQNLDKEMEPTHEQLFLQMQANMRKMLGEQHPDIERILDNLAELYQNREKGDVTVIESMFLQMLEITREVFGEQHPHLVQSLNNLAELYVNLWLYDKAEPLYIEALEIRRKILREQHPDIADSLNTLAELYRKQRRYEEAEPLYIEAREIWCKVSRGQHPNMAICLNNLALLYKSQRRYEEAEPLYKEALTIFRNVLGEQHPIRAETLHNLAGLYKSQRRYEEAESLYKEALMILHKASGEQKLFHIATSLNNLGSVYQNQRRYEEAKTLYKEALAIYTKVFGKMHPYTLIAFYNYTMLNNPFLRIISRFNDKFFEDTPFNR